MSISGTALILVTVVIRAVAIDRLPKETFLALWGITLLRLLLPFSVPSSFSVYSLLGQNISVLELAGTNNVTVSTIVNSTAQELPVSLWPIIWGAGAVMFAAMFFLPWLRCRREFQTSLPVENDYIEGWLQRHPLRRNIRIRELTGISTPLTYGILHPIILMPEDTDRENTRRLEYILFHEYVHICRWDGLVKLAATAALCVHWFNPMVWVLYILLNRDIELACDAAVLRHFGKADRADYARMLIAIKGRSSRIEPLCSHFGKNVMERRVKSVMKYRKSSVLTIVLALVLAGTVAIVFGTSAKAADVSEDIGKMEEDTQQQEIEKATEPTTQDNGTPVPPISESNHYVIYEQTNGYFHMSVGGNSCNMVGSNGRPYAVVFNRSGAGVPDEDSHVCYTYTTGGVK